MTVKGLQAHSSSSYVCQWFDGTKQDNGSFHADSLVAVDQDDSTPTDFMQTRQ
jgi:uncharacterized protein YodC (DUF2158 family)